MLPTYDERPVSSSANFITTTASNNAISNTVSNNNGSTIILQHCICICYRLWIYACNTVLALATLVFTVFAVSVLVDPRISLLSGVELYQPTFLYAYVALLLQCGVLQAIGCVGALRLNQRLLNTYWTLLLVLMIGDILVGLVWAFRLDQIKSNLRPLLKQKLVALYGKDDDFTQVWDWVQHNDMCCGVDGPIDFQRINESTFGPFDAKGLANDTWASYLIHQQNSQPIPKLPSTCCDFHVTPVTTPEPPPPPPPLSSSEMGGGGNRRHKGRGNGGGKGDHRWNPNDALNAKGGGGGYYPPPVPQQLKTSSSFHSSYLDNLQATNGTGSSTASNSLSASNLRKFPLTDPQLPTAFSYFGTGTGAGLPPVVSHTGTHNRRKISHAKNKNLDEYGYSDRNRWGSRPTVTTTESPGGRSSSPIGVCVLPSDLRQPPSSSSSSSSSDSSSSSMESGGSGSFEDIFISSSEFSTSSQPPPHPAFQFSSTWAPTTSASTSADSEFISSTERSQFNSQTSSPPSEGRKGPNTSSSSSSNRSPYPHPFTVSMQQHGEGCGDKILEWVEHSSDVLFVIGFCIIVFLKGCFIAILRYEIKEMIEKIKLLNGEDAGRTAAMNELIGLTSMYESGNDDSGEREGLMAGVHGNGDTSNTNIDTIDPNDGVGGGVIPSTTISSQRHDSIHYLKENHLMGNNVGPPPPRHLGNHIGGFIPPSTNDDYPRMLQVTSISSPSTNKHDIEEDFDSGSALLGGYPKHSESPIVNSKRQHQFHRNENGGRGLLPRNGNNNAVTTIEMPGPVLGVPTSVSAPLPIDAIARVTNPPIH